MSNSLKLLEWDTEFFGYTIAKVIAENLDPAKMAELVEEADSVGTRLLYLFTDPADELSNGSAIKIGAKLVDQKVTFHIKIAEEFSAITDEHIESFDLLVPTEKLIDLAIQSGLYSRYKTDKHFQNGEFEKLYSKWIENSVNKKIADHTLVYKLDEKILGFVTLKIKNKCGEIGLIAVDETSRGRSIGKKLVHAVVDTLKRQRIKELDVATQINNEDACNFYKKIGFTASKTECIYHIWL
ncbi:MAG: GNAT family N-acetyltransferase [Ferruginibacter sp.]